MDTKTANDQINQILQNHWIKIMKVGETSENHELWKLLQLLRIGQIEVPYFDQFLDLKRKQCIGFEIHNFDCFILYFKNQTAFQNYHDAFHFTPIDYLEYETTRPLSFVIYRSNPEGTSLFSALCAESLKSNPSIPWNKLFQHQGDPFCAHRNLYGSMADVGITH